MIFLVLTIMINMIIMAQQFIIQRTKMTFNNTQSLIKLALSLLILVFLNGCAVIPAELDSLGQDDHHHFARKIELPEQYQSITQNLSSNSGQLALTENKLTSFAFTRGDVLRIRFKGMPELDGLYQINTNGNLELPFANAIQADSHSRESLIEVIEDELVRLQWFYSDTVNVDVSLVRMAPINVSVFGAVFNPGRVSINNQPALKQEDAIQQTGGVYSSARDLIAALTAAGGVRPDANLTAIYLKRGTSIRKLSLESLLDGTQFKSTPSLIGGDIIVVESTGIENERLIRPSQITPPGMRIFMSNLTAPALTNTQSAIGADSTRLPYGSSLLDSAISANCIGGTHMANASRSVVLVTRNYGSKQQIVVRRSINQLLANSSNDSVNPYVMPNDGIACYDSRFTNFRDVARGIGEVISPILLGGLL